MDMKLKQYEERTAKRPVYNNESISKLSSSSLYQSTKIIIKV